MDIGICFEALYVFIITCIYYAVNSLW